MQARHLTLIASLAAATFLGACASMGGGNAGEPMPSIDAKPAPPSNIVPFPKRLSPERRKQILLAALEHDDA